MISIMLIAGNWKMNYGLKELYDFSNTFKSFEPSKDIDLCIIPPFPIIKEAKHILQETKINVGAQCCHYKLEGSFTGDVSPKLLSEIGCDYVITGHSERRSNHLETNAYVKNTVLSLINKNITPIICVGETQEEKRKGNTFNFIKKQVSESVPIINDALIVVAYEPIWAIGSGNIPSEEEIEKIHNLIREELNSIPYLKVIYGGSVNEKNCKEIFSIPSVEGALIGGASLNFKEFLAIYNSGVKYLNSFKR